MQTNYIIIHIYNRKNGWSGDACPLLIQQGFIWGVGRFHPSAKKSCMKPWRVYYDLATIGFSSMKMCLSPVTTLTTTKTPHWSQTQVILIERDTFWTAHTFYTAKGLYGDRTVSDKLQNVMHKAFQRCLT